MVDNICQLTFKFKYHDKNCICIFIKLWCLICLVSTTNYSILQKKVLLKLWVNGNSTSVHYVNIANKRGCVHLKIVFPRRSAATYSKDQIIRAVLNPPHVDVSFLCLLKTTFRGYNITINFNQFLVNQF